MKTRPPTSWLPLVWSLAVLFVLIGCSSGPSVASPTTLQGISPQQGTNQGGVSVTLTGENIFSADNDSGFVQNLEIQVCGELLTDVVVTGIQTRVRSNSGSSESVTIGSTVTGKTSVVGNPATATSDVVLTRPDGTSISLENAFDCNDAPTLSATGAVTIQEVAQENTLVTTIQAGDVDNSALQYEIIGGNANDTFSINANNGELRIANRINHNTNATFDLVIKVTDAEGLSVDDTITINVTRDTTVYNWRLVSSWPTQESLYTPIDTIIRNTLRPRLSSQSANQLNITITAPTVGLDSDIHNKVSTGTFDMGHTATSLYRSINTANDFFTSQPSGLSESQYKAWLLAEGQDLWDELNARSSLIAFRAGTSGDKSVGWFRQPITNPSQLNGLRWRMADIASVVAEDAGIYVPRQNELAALTPFYNALRNGSLDAVKWSGPYVDWQNNLHLSGAIYYPTPDWGQPNAALSLYVNLDKYNALPVRLQNVIKSVAELTADTMSDRYKTLNAQGLTNIRNSGITIMTFPQNVRDELALHSEAFMENRAANNPFYARIYESWKKFK